jgi:hypothetical protein
MALLLIDEVAVNTIRRVLPFFVAPVIGLSVALQG